MARQNKPGYQAERKESVTYGLFYLGQNLLWGFAGFIETFLTDIGIAPDRAAAILLLPKLWDAVNDVLFGYIVDRFRFKNGQKFIPWVKIGVWAIGITTIALFAIPAEMAENAKLLWFFIAYVLFDAAYTVLDTPSFALATVMTTNIEERTSIIATGKLWAMVGGVLSTVLIPMIRPALGWFWACVVFIVVSVILMIPIMYTVKERVEETGNVNAEPTFREMLNYLGKNKYLLVVLLAMFLLGVASVEQKMAIYMGRVCLGQESAATLVAAGVAVMVIVVSAIIPRLSRRWDIFNIMIAGLIFSVVMGVVSYFVGYDSLPVALVMIMLKCAGLGFWQVIIYMLIADTVEYGTYKTGTRATGITFSLQCFIAKLKNAVIGSFILLILARVGFVEGEGAVQPAGVDRGVWGLFNLVPSIGFALSVLLLVFFYKLRSKDIQTMAAYNNGEITREEAEAILGEKYGPAG